MERRRISMQSRPAAWLVACALAMPAMPEAAACDRLDALWKCYAGTEMTETFKDVTRRAEQRGQRMLGESFHLSNRVRFNKRRQEFQGDIDAVAPVFSSMSGNEEGFQEALSFQTGVTKWTYKRSVNRHDWRHGLIYRMGDAESWHGGMWSMWGFYQHDPGRDHAGVLAGADYEGMHGRLGLSYFEPTTGWREGSRAGYEERALRGGSADVRLSLGRDVSLRGRLSRREKRTGREYQFSGSAGGEYRARSWLTLGGEWRASSRGSKLKGTVSAEWSLGSPSRRSSRRGYSMRFGRKAHEGVGKPRRIEVREQRSSS